MDVVLVVTDEVENGYHRANSYHNAVHATDVTQAMNCYINEQKVCTLWARKEVTFIFAKTLAYVECGYIFFTMDKVLERPS